MDGRECFVKVNGGVGPEWRRKAVGGARRGIFDFVEIRYG
jgi:hypothetical protein